MDGMTTVEQLLENVADNEEVVIRHVWNAICVKRRRLNRDGSVTESERVLLLEEIRAARLDAIGEALWDTATDVRGVEEPSPVTLWSEVKS